jgi:hypothetical protein
VTLKSNAGPALSMGLIRSKRLLGTLHLPTLVAALMIWE